MTEQQRAKNSSKKYSNTVRDIVFKHFMQTGESSTVKEIAAHAPFSESTVRLTLEGCGMVVPGTDFAPKEIAIHSRNYPSMIQSHRMVDAYLPSREEMRRRLIEADLITDREVRQAMRKVAGVD